MARAKKKAKKKRKATVPPRKRGGKTLAGILKKAAREKRPTRFRYDGDGNIIGVYIPLQHQTKAEQKRATKAMVSACSAGAYRQGVSPSKTCGYRGLKPSAEAGRGLAYARWGFPRGWPKPRKVHNPTYTVGSLTVKTFKDDEGDYGYAVYSPRGEPLTIATGEPSEKMAAREGKAEARFQEEILEIEARTMWEGNPRRTPARKKSNPWGSKMPKMSDKDWNILSVSQDLEQASSTLGGIGGRVEITSQTQRIVRDRAEKVIRDLKSVRGPRGKDLRDRARGLITLSKLPIDALRLYYEMVRAKGQKLRVTKADRATATKLVTAKQAKRIKTAAGTEYITVPWAVGNPRTSAARKKSSNPKAGKRVINVRSLVARALR